MNFIQISLFVLWFAVILLLVLNLYLTKYIVQFLNSFRITGSQAAKLELTIGAKAPLFREYDQKKREVKLIENNGTYTLLVFASKNCNYCKEIIPGLPLIIKNLDLRIIVISKEPLDYLEKIYDEIHIINSAETFENYFIQTVPSIILVDEKNQISFSKSVTSLFSLTEVLGQYFNTNINYQNIKKLNA